MRPCKLGLGVAGLMLVAATSACLSYATADPNIDTQTPAFEKARLAAIGPLNQRIKHVIGNRTPVAAIRTDSCNSGDQSFENGTTPYQWNCTLQYASIVAVPGSNQTAAVQAAAPMLQAAGCPDAKIKRKLLGTDGPGAGEVYGQDNRGDFTETCRVPAVVPLSLVAVDTDSIKETVEFTAPGWDLMINRQAPDPADLIRALQHQGIHYVLVVSAEQDYYDVPW